MKTSKFVQLDPKVLMEYIYEDTFLTAENYVVTTDLNQDLNSFAANNDEGSNNRYSNQLVLIDPVRNKYGIRDDEEYNFILDKNYNQNLPVQYDRVKLHFPIDYSFDDYVGCYLKVYVMDYNNDKLVNLSSYYFDKQDQDRFNNELQLSSPPNTFNGRLWGKYIEVAYPSPNAISRQRTNNIANANSINYNISSGVGISNTSPVMVEFGFITKKEILNGVTTFLLRDPYQTSVPQTPDFKNLAVKIEPNTDGDWFDIYGTYNGNIAEFNNWIQVSILNGQRYYVEYAITTFEENIKNKTLKTIIDVDFNEKIEFRPIIKYSSTTAAIEVLMSVIDRGDGSVITRRASYGLMPDEISKYSRNLTRINVQGVKTPKIYNLRSGGSMYDAFDGLNNRKFNLDVFGDGIQTVKVPYPILVNANNILAKTDSAIADGKLWKGFGKLKLVVEPFDNIFKFTLAKDVRAMMVVNTNNNTTRSPISLSPILTDTTTRSNLAKRNYITNKGFNTGLSLDEFTLRESRFTSTSTSQNISSLQKSAPTRTAGNASTSTTVPSVQVEYFNLLEVGEINLHFKNYDREVKVPIYRKTGENDLKNGTVVFKLNKNKVNDVRQIYESGINMFYITATNEETEETTVLYEGTFIMSDSIQYVEDLSDSYEENVDGSTANVQVIRDYGKETAVVTRRRTLGD